MALAQKVLLILSISFMILRTRSLSCGGIENCNYSNDGCNVCIDVNGECKCTQLSTGCSGSNAYCMTCSSGFHLDGGKCVENSADFCGGYTNCLSYTDGCSMCQCRLDSGEERCRTRDCAEKGNPRCLICAMDYNLADDGTCVPEN